MFLKWVKKGFESGFPKTKKKKKKKDHEFFYLISFPHVLASSSLGHCGRVFHASGKFYSL